MIDKKNNPWLGLSSYQICDSSRFFGREREMEEISASIKDNYCTILYGVSGAGKTSIINAGLCPKLSAEGYLPITIRMDHNGQSYSNQIITACISIFKQTGTEYECPFDTSQIQALDARDALWIFFHASTFWSKDNRKVVPILFIDQFEEIFTLAESEEQTLSFFQQVDSLFSSAPSERLISRLESSDMSFDFSESPRFRMVLSMREDFLARLEDYCYNLPILRRNRIGLRKMNGIQALDVIMKPQRGLVAENVALQIVSAVTGKDCSGDRARLQMLAVDTSILSLFCSELYQLSADKNAEVFTSDIVETEGGDIIKRFYEKNISKLSKRGRKYLELHLLTSNGFRNQLAVEDINYSLIKESDIKALESSRIIRKEIINGTERIEFTHDILCKAAMESRRKAIERNVRLSSIISYSAFTLVCVYIVHYILVFVNYDLNLLWLEKLTLSDLFRENIRHLLMILYGLLYLPLCIPSSRKKNKYVDVFLIVFGVIIGLTKDKVYYTDWAIWGRNLNWAAWVLLLAIVPFINICSSATQMSIKDYFKNVSILSLNEKDKWQRTIIYILVLVGTYQLLQKFKFVFFRLANSKAIISITCFFSATTIFLLFAVIISVIIPSFIKNENRKRILMLSIVQICLIMIYLMTQYSHERWTSYVSLIALLIISTFGLRDYLVSFYKAKKYVKFACIIASTSLLLLTANYISSINILALKNNAKAFDLRGCWNQTKIVSPDGLYGIMEGSDIIVPPSFVAINQDDIDIQRNLHWYILPGNNKDRNPRLDTWLTRLINRKAYSYRVRDDKGVASSWRIMEHPELDNKYSRKIPKIAKTYYDDTYIWQLAADYYYQKAVVESRAKYQDEFDIASERLFFLSFGNERVDLAVNSFYNNRRRYSEKTLLKYIQNGTTQDDADSSLVKTCKPESPIIIYQALKHTIQSKAIKSDTLLNNISNLVDSYSDAEYYIAKTKCKGLLCLLRGEYNDAIKYAKISSDDEILAEALILYGDLHNIDLINNLTKRTNAEGRFLGETIMEDIQYLGDQKKLQQITILNDCSILPPKYIESIPLDLSHIRRTLSNGEVLFLESGKIISKYQKIVYPSNAIYQYGVYFKNGKRGFIDPEGHEITDAIFDHAWLFSKYNGLAVVEVNGKIGFINDSGNYSLSPSLPMQDELRYYKDWIFEADGKLVFPGEERKFGLLDSTGRWIVDPIYGEIGEYKFGFRVFGDSVSGKYGLMDRYGKVVIPLEDHTIDVDDEYIYVWNENYDVNYYKHDGYKIIEKVSEYRYEVESERM